MATVPEAILQMVDGIINGDTRRGPLENKTKDCSCMRIMPPMPVPMMTPQRSDAESSIEIFASSAATLAAATAK